MANEELRSRHRTLCQEIMKTLEDLTSMKRREREMCYDGEVGELHVLDFHECENRLRRYKSDFADRYPEQGVPG